MILTNLEKKERRVEGVDPITAEEKKKAKKLRIGLIAIILLGIIAYFVIPSFKTFINESFSVLKGLDIDGVIEYLRSYGAYAALVSFILMVLSSVIAPIPAFLITLSNAVIFGWWKGALLSWSSAMVGAALCFYISRILGREVAVKFTGNDALASVDEFLQEYGVQAIVVFRLLPFMSFDLISYAAGLTSMKFLPYFIATGIGQTPATIVYSYAGHAFTGGASMVFKGLMIIFALSIVIYVGKKVWNDKNKKKANKSDLKDESADDVMAEDDKKEI